ncbi:uncharacterized protein LOC129228241 [Uloborus diversus]|uniref:uncharacterized protein LOC129228241 n=1 Tax=Uloborus diversus TaxID=327109 RepID=UPI002409AFE5|nr:uncharacterized protein LOC129228241 [Uloborus diversus]
MKSFVLVAVVFLLHVLKADGQNIFDMNPTLSETPLWQCVRRKFCECGEENEVKKCTDLIEDSTFRFILNNTEICVGIEDRTAKGMSWICDDASSYERQCGEQIFNNLLSPDFATGVGHVLQLEFTKAERVREVRSFSFFVCIAELLTRCVVYPDEC